MYSSPVCPPGYVRSGARMHRLRSEGCKKLQSPSLDFALRASVASHHCSQICLEQIWAHTLRSKSEVHGCTSSKFAPDNFVTKGAAIGQESRCHEAQGCARMAISSFFTSFALSTVHPCTTPHYARQANTTAWMQEVERIRRQSRELLYTL